MFYVGIDIGGTFTDTEETDQGLFSWENGRGIRGGCNGGVPHFGRIKCHNRPDRNHPLRPSYRILAYKSKPVLWLGRSRP